MLAVKQCLMDFCQPLEHRVPILFHILGQLADEEQRIHAAQLLANPVRLVVVRLETAHYRRMAARHEGCFEF